MCVCGGILRFHVVSNYVPQVSTERSVRCVPLCVACTRKGERWYLAGALGTNRNRMKDNHVIYLCSHMMHRMLLVFGTGKNHTFEPITHASSMHWLYVKQQPANLK